MKTQTRIIPKGIVWPFALLTILFFAWAVPNNLTDTMLAAFKRIMSLSDSKTAWIQVVCYFLGYGCCAIPGALLIQKFSYKTGVEFGLALYALGTFLFYPAMKISVGQSMEFGFVMFLLAIFVLFAGLSILETATNSYVVALGDQNSATRRLNFAQSFNPFGAITGVLISQIFILSQLNTLDEQAREALSAEDLIAMQGQELHHVTMTYVILGVVMVAILTMIHLTKMPDLKETGKIDFKGSFKRLMGNKMYIWSVVAQFFYVGAQIAVWSFVIRYAIHALDFNGIIATLETSLGRIPSSEEVIAALRGVEPVSACFYNLCELLNIDALLPRTAEQAGATFYIFSLILFVACRFVCTFLMKYIKPTRLLAIISLLAVLCCLGTVFGNGAFGVYCLMGISGCMSLMFPTIYAMGVSDLGEDTKLGGSGMIMAIAGAALLTQIQGIISDASSSIANSYWVPAFAFAVILYYSIFPCSKYQRLQ